MNEIQKSELLIVILINNRTENIYTHTKKNKKNRLCSSPFSLQKIVQCSESVTLFHHQSLTLLKQRFAIYTDKFISKPFASK